MDIKFLIIIISIIIFGSILIGIKLIFHFIEMKKVNNILNYYQKKIDESILMKGGNSYESPKYRAK